MHFRSDHVFTLKPHTEFTFTMSWNPGGKNLSGGTGDKGPLYITAYPYHKIGESGKGNVFDGKLVVNNQGVSFVDVGKGTLQHYVYSLTVRNRGPKSVSFMLTGSSVGEQL